MRTFKKNNPIFIFSLVAILLVFLHLVGILRPVEDLLLWTVKPINSRLYGLGASFSDSYNTSKKNTDLQAKIDSLTREVAALTVASSQCHDVAEENNKLKAILKFSAESSSKSVAAKIIAKEAVSDGGDIIIDRGKRDGLRSGLVVVSEEGIVVGKVIEAKDSSAQVCLTISPNCQLAGMVQNQNHTQGITDGDLGLTIKMNYIPQLEKIAPGDIITTSGLGDNIQRGLVIGRITQVRNGSNEVWQEATIEPPLNFDGLTVVSVIIP
jgi:rod shape-determining protein MreC